MKVQTGEYSSYSNNLIDEHGKSKVWLWDCGPEEPAPPDTSGAHRNAWVTCNEAAALSGSGASASAAARANLANRIMGGSPGRIADRF